MADVKFARCTIAKASPTGGPGHLSISEDGTFELAAADIGGSHFLIGSGRASNLRAGSIRSKSWQALLQVPGWGSSEGPETSLVFIRTALQCPPVLLNPVDELLLAKAGPGGTSLNIWSIAGVAGSDYPLEDSEFELEVFVFA